MLFWSPFLSLRHRQSFSECWCKYSHSNSMILVTFTIEHFPSIQTLEAVTHSTISLIILAMALFISFRTLGPCAGPYWLRRSAMRWHHLSWLLAKVNLLTLRSVSIVLSFTITGSVLLMKLTCSWPSVQDLTSSISSGRPTATLSTVLSLSFLVWLFWLILSSLPFFTAWKETTIAY